MIEKPAKPDPYALAEQLLVECYTNSPEKSIAQQLYLRYWRQEWFVYHDGCYRRIGVDELKAAIAGFLHKHQLPVTTHFVAAIVLALTHACMIESRQSLDAWLDGINGAQVIAAANGNASLTDRDADGRPRLLRHTSQYFTLSRLAYNYDPDAKCPLWQTFLADVMQGNEAYCMLLQEFCGYIFRTDLNEHKFLMLVGEGANGKGVFCSVVEALAGEANVSHTPLARFENPFALYATIGKRVNITSEGIAVVEEFGESQLKSFVAGDSMSFERKFLSPVEARPTAKLIIATNTLPRFSDKTMGVWRRVLLVPFNRIIAEENQVKGLAAELRTQLPGILNWALAGLDRLNRQGHFTIPDENRQLLEDYRRDADPCRAFLCEHYTFSPNAFGAVSAEVYAAYRDFCQANGFQPMNERNFGKQVRRIFPGCEHRRLGGRGERSYVYTGLVAAEPVEELCQESTHDETK